MRRFLVVTGIILLVAAGLWKLGISPSYEQRISPEWTWEYDSLGTWAYIENEADFDTSLENDEVAASQFLQRVAAEGFSRDSATILSDYADVDPLTQEVDWGYTDETTVNPVTGRYLDPELSDYLFVFPRAVEKMDYVLWDTYYGVMTFEYANEEIIGGLRTYRFSFTPELLDETAVYLINEYIEEGQAIGCLDTEVEYFIEPITGEVVIVNETCPREYYLDPETLEPIAPYGRWQVLSSGDSTQHRVETVQSLISTYLLMTSYVPLALASLGVVLLIAGIFVSKSRVTDQNKR